MTTTSNRPILVDGVRLDTLAVNISQVNVATAPRRPKDQNSPGISGVIASLNDTLDQATMGLSMFVRGTDPNGLVPPGMAAQTKLQANLDALTHLFGQRHRLVELWRQTGEGTLAYNFMVNGGFESYTTPTAVSDGWTTWTAGTTAGSWSKSTTTGVVAPGVNAQRVASAAATFGATTGDQLGITQTYLVPYGASGQLTLTLSADLLVQLLPAGSVVRFVVDALDYDRNLLGNVINQVVATTTGLGRRVATATTPLPEGTAMYRVTIYGDAAGATASGNLNYYLDNVLLTDDGGTVYFDGSTTPDTLHRYAYIAPVPNQAETDEIAPIAGVVYPYPSRRIPKAMRRAMVKVTDVIAPNLNDIGSTATFSVAFNVVRGYWEDQAVTDSTGVMSVALPAGTSGASVEVPSLRGSSERVDDAILYVFNPGVSAIGPVRLSDIVTGAWCQIASIPGRCAWRLNVGTWASTIIGPPVPTAISSDDTLGTDASGSTTYGGMRVAGGPFLPLTPRRSGGGLRIVELNLTVTQSSAQTINVWARTRRKYAL